MGRVDAEQRSAAGWGDAFEYTPPLLLLERKAPHPDAARKGVVGPPHKGEV
jgi:hypothetical protein